MNSAAHFVGAASIELAFALLCLSAVKIYKDAQIHCPDGNTNYCCYKFLEVV